MPSIQSSPYPLVFKVNRELALPEPGVKDDKKICIRTVARALDGMQKEAVVHDTTTGSAWRMVCDEGPWLNGTDLSSFPLGFYSAGMAATFASEIQALAKQHDILPEEVHLVQDARYGMEGSAVKRTMVGSALPIHTEIRITCDAPVNVVNNLIYQALAASPADAVMRGKLPSRFRITNNGRDIAVGKVAASAIIGSEDPAELFDGLQPVAEDGFAPGILEKLEGADTSNARKSQAVGYAEEQKRVVEVRSVLDVREDGLKAIQVQCIKPEGGSVFNFLSDDPVLFGGRERAPTGLQYLSAGVSFCYMTQVGRFAAIAKQDLSSYRIVQDTGFSLPGASAGLTAPASADPVDTHVFLSSADDDDTNRVLVDMGEQTCYLHACYRGGTKTRLRIL